MAPLPMETVFLATGCEGLVFECRAPRPGITQMARGVGWRAKTRRDIQMGICLCAGSKRGVHLNKTERSSLPCFVSSSLRCLNALAARPEFFRLGNQQPIALTDWGEAGLGRAVWGGKTAAYGRSVRSLVVAVAVPAAHPRGRRKG